MGGVAIAYESETKVMNPPSCDIRQLGEMDYITALEIQRSLAEQRFENSISDTLLLLEHPATITIGRSGSESNIVTKSEHLAREGISFVETDRGGDVTYHGPGQLVGYPILNLNTPPHQPDLHRYLRNLEEVLIRTLSYFDINAGRFSPHTGVWVDLKSNRPIKIAAIGIKASRWITSHGFALNVCPNMQHFDNIIPCGITEYGVTSMQEYLCRKTAVEAIIPILEQEFLEVFGLIRSMHNVKSSVGKN